MANFVESATLLIRDESSASIRKINAELNALFKAANSLKSKPIKINLTLAGVSDIINKIEAIKTLGKKNIEFKIGVAGLSAVNAELRRLEELKQKLAKSTVVPIVPAPAPLPPAKPKASPATFAGSKTMPKNAAGQALPTPQGRAFYAAGPAATVPPPPPPPPPPPVPRPRSSAPRPQQNQPSVLGTSLNFTKAVIGLASFTVGLNAATAVLRNIVSGTRIRDIAESKLAQQNLKPNENFQIEQAAQSLNVKANVVGNTGDFKGLIGEALLVTNGNVNAAIEMVKLQVPLFQKMAAEGSSKEDIFQKANELNKALDSMGKMTDQNGNFDPVMATKYMQVAVQSMVQSGKDIGPMEFRNAIRALGSTAMTLSPEGLLKAIARFEEQGFRAMTGENLIIKSLFTGTGKKQILQNRADFELADLKEVQTGSTLGGGKGGKKRKKSTQTSIVQGGIVDAEMLMTDPDSWIQKYVLPQMQKRGLNPSDPVDAGKVANMLFGDRNAAAEFTARLQKNASIKKSSDIAGKRDVSEAKQGEIAGQSSTAQFEILASKFQGLLGEAGNSMETILLPAVKSVSSAMAQLANFIAGPTGEGDPARAGAVVGGTVAAGGLLAIGAAAITKAVTSFITGSGQTNALLITSNGLLAQIAANTAMQNAASGLGSKAGGVATGGLIASVSSFFKNAMKLGGPIVATQGALQVGDDATSEEKLKFRRFIHTLFGMDQDPSMGTSFNFPKQISVKPSSEKLYSLDGNKLTRRNADPSTVIPVKVVGDVRPTASSVPPTGEKLYSLDGNKLTRRNADPSTVIPVKVVSSVRPTASATPPNLTSVGPKDGTNGYLEFLNRKMTNADAMMGTKPDNGAAIRAAFETGGASAAAKVEAGGATFGSTAGGNILAVAGQFGAIVASAISAAAANVTVNTAQAPRKGVPPAPGRIPADTGRVGQLGGPH